MQATPLPNLVLLSWSEIVVVLTANSAIVLLLGRLLFDDNVKKSLRRSKADVQDMLKEWFSEERKQFNEALVRLRTAEENLKTITEKFDEQSRRQAIALEDMAKTLRIIEERSSRTALSVARIEGAMRRSSAAGKFESDSL